MNELLPMRTAANTVASPAIALSADESTESRPPPSQVRRWLLIAVIAGIFARIIPWLLAPQIYHDEAYLLNNLFDRSYAELLKPLQNAQAAPPALLWAIKWCGGFSIGDRSMRCVSVAVSFAGLWLFAILCRMTLRSYARWFALGVFSSSHVLIVSANRAKPYACDLFVSLIITTLTLLWLRRPQRLQALILLALLTPLLLWMSYTSVFVAGGAGIVITTRLFAGRSTFSRHVWLVCVWGAATMLVSFALLYAWNLRPSMYVAAQSGLQEFWREAFPPLDRIPALAWWMIQTHTGRLYAYPVGERIFGSLVPFGFWMCGVCHFWRRRDGRELLALLLLPQGLLLLAACLKAYPYGGHPRITLFLAPSMCLLIGTGIFVTTHRWKGALRTQMRSVIAVSLLLLAVLPVGWNLVRDLATHQPSLNGQLRLLAEGLRSRDRVVVLEGLPGATEDGPATQVANYYIRRILGARAQRKSPRCAQEMADHCRPGDQLVLLACMPTPKHADEHRATAELPLSLKPDAGHTEERHCPIIPGVSQLSIWQWVCTESPGQDNRRP